MSKTSFDIRPLYPNPKQAEYLIATSDFENNILCYYGGAGGGKTTAEVTSLIDLAVKVPGNRIAVCRKIKADVEKTIQEDFFIYCPPQLILDHKKTDGVTTIRSCDPMYPSEVYWLGLDELTRWGGFHFGQIFVEEAVEISVKDFNFLKTRLRHNLPKDAKVPVGCEYIKADPSQPRGFRLRRFISLCFNPPEKPEHWLYELIFEKTVQKEKQAVRCIHTTTYDNKENLDDEYFAMLESLPKHERMRLLFGQKASGGTGRPVSYVFAESPAKFLFKGACNQLRFLHTGMDYGWRHPCMIWGSFEDNSLYVYEILSKSEMDLRQFLKQEVKGVEQSFHPDCAFLDFVDHQHARQHSDKDKKTSEQIMRECGRNPRHSYSRPEWRAQLINELFSQGRLYIHENCFTLISALEYGWSRDDKGEIFKDGFWEHIGDSLGYLVWGLFGGKLFKKPRNSEPKEDLQTRAIKHALREKDKKGWFR